MLRCPRCYGQRIHQSRRKGMLEKGILAAIFVNPFRCETCNCRVFRSSFAANPNELPTKALAPHVTHNARSAADCTEVSVLGAGK